MTRVYDHSIEFVLQYAVVRHGFEEWTQDDKIITDQKLLNKYELIYRAWLKNQQGCK